MEKIRLAEIAAAMNGRLLQGSLEAEVSGISIDSRAAEPGQLFFALPGSKTDGHLHVGEAMDRGAAAAVISRHLPAAVDRPLIMVADPLQALQDLAGYYRRLFSAPVVAVTGSTGKTTTKDLIAGVLGKSFRVLKTEGNQNNEIGLPLTLLRLDHGCGAVVLEMAMRGRGEIAALCRLSRPDIGVITNIGKTHLERLGSQRAIARAKGELLEALPPGGCAVLNGEDPWQRRLARRCHCEVIFYGRGGRYAVNASRIAVPGLRGVEFLLHTPRGDAPVRLPLPGRHNVSNALAAAAVGHRLGLLPGQIAGGLEAASLTGMRLEIRQGIRGSTVIDDTYNASPDSVRAALQLLVEAPLSKAPLAEAPGRGRAIAVLGDMYELGAEAAAEHRSVGEDAAGLQVDHLCTVGELAREIARGAREAGLPEHRISAFAGKSEAIAFIQDYVKSGDVILIKGSRGARMEEIVASLVEGD